MKPKFLLFITLILLPSKCQTEETGFKQNFVIKNQNVVLNQFRECHQHVLLMGDQFQFLNPLFPNHPIVLSSISPHKNNLMVFHQRNIPKRARCTANILFLSSGIPADVLCYLSIPFQYYGRETYIVIFNYLDEHPNLMRSCGTGDDSFITSRYPANFFVAETRNIFSKAEAGVLNTELELEVVSLAYTCPRCFSGFKSHLLAIKYEETSNLMHCVNTEGIRKICSSAGNGDLFIDIKSLVFENSKTMPTKGEFDDESLAMSSYLILETYDPKNLLQFQYDNPDTNVPNDLLPMTVLFPSYIDINVTHFEYKLNRSENSNLMLKCPRYSVSTESKYISCPEVEDYAAKQALGLPEPWYYARPYFLPTFSRSYIYITCSNVESKRSTSFDFYFTPFDPATWIVVISMIVLISLMLVGISHTRSWKLFVDCLFIIVSPMLEISPEVTNRVEKIRFFSKVLGMWMMFGIILSNGYKGILTNSVVAPNSFDPPKSWFELVHNTSFLVYTVEDDAERGVGRAISKDEVLEQYELPSSHSIFEDDLCRSAYEDNPLIRCGMVHSLLTFNESYRDMIYQAVRLGTQLYRRVRNIARTESEDQSENRNEPFGYKTVELELANCNNTAFADTLQNYENYLRYVFPKRSWKKNQKYFVSQDPSFETTMFLVYDANGNPIVNDRLKRSVESGIYNYLRKIFWYAKIIRYIGFSVDDSFQPQSMDSNISIVFVVYVILIFNAILVFFSEKSVSLISFLMKNLKRKQEELMFGEDVVKQF